MTKLYLEAEEQHALSTVASRQARSEAAAAQLSSVTDRATIQQQLVTPCNATRCSSPQAVLQAEVPALKLDLDDKRVWWAALMLHELNSRRDDARNALLLGSQTPRRLKRVCACHLLARR